MTVDSVPKTQNFRQLLTYGILLLGLCATLLGCPTGVPSGEGMNNNAQSGGDRLSGDSGAASYEQDRTQEKQGDAALGLDSSENTEYPQNTDSFPGREYPAGTEQASGNEYQNTDRISPNPDEAPVTEQIANDASVVNDASSPDSGQLGDTCQHACDCIQGLDCQQGKCVQPSLPIYCCSKSLCPPGEACITRKNSRSQCATGPKCTTNCDCPQGQLCYSGGCQKTKVPVYCCEKAGCPEGTICFDKNGTQKTCTKAGGPSGCQHTCDCSQGLLCVNQICIKVGNPVYCCDKTSCPSGKTCVWRVGGLGNCKPNQIRCKSSCDCQVGESCFNGACTKSNAMHCCSRKNQCPSGQICQDKQGALRICGSGRSCTNKCDCPAQETCFNGRCIGSTQSVPPCCTSQNCPKGKFCYKPNGSFGSCP